MNIKKIVYITLFNIFFVLWPMHAMQRDDILNTKPQLQLSQAMHVDISKNIKRLIKIYTVIDNDCIENAIEIYQRYANNIFLSIFPHSRWVPPTLLRGGYDRAIPTTEYLLQYQSQHTNQVNKQQLKEDINLSYYNRHNPYHNICFFLHFMKTNSNTKTYIESAMDALRPKHPLQAGVFNLVGHILNTTSTWDDQKIITCLILLNDVCKDTNTGQTYLQNPLIKQQKQQIKAITDKFNVHKKVESQEIEKHITTILDIYRGSNSKVILEIYISEPETIEDKDYTEVTDIKRQNINITSVTNPLAIICINTEEVSSKKTTASKNLEYLEYHQQNPNIFEHSVIENVDDAQELSETTIIETINENLENGIITADEALNQLDNLKNNDSCSLISTAITKIKTHSEQIKHATLEILLKFGQDPNIKINTLKTIFEERKRELTETDYNECLTMFQKIYLLYHIAIEKKPLLDNEPLFNKPYWTNIINEAIKNNPALSQYQEELFHALEDSNTSQNSKNEETSISRSSENSSAQSPKTIPATKDLSEISSTSLLTNPEIPKKPSFITLMFMGMGNAIAYIFSPLTTIISFMSEFLKL